MKPHFRFRHGKWESHYDRHSATYKLPLTRHSSFRTCVENLKMYKPTVLRFAMEM